MSWWIFILLFTLFLAVFIGTVVGIHNYLITYDSKRKEKIINSLRNLSNDYDVKRMFFEEVRSDHDFSAYIRREAKSRINAIVANEKQNWINHISRAINVLEKKEKDRLEEYRSYKKVLTYLEQMYIIGEDEKIYWNTNLMIPYTKKMINNEGIEFFSMEEIQLGELIRSFEMVQDYMYEHSLGISEEEI